MRAEPVPRLLGLATAAPPHTIAQADAEAFASALFADIPYGFDRFAPVFENAAVEARHSCVPIAWYGEQHGMAEKNALYVECALDLLERAATDALADADLTPQQIDVIVTVSSTGISTPALDARLMQRMPFREDVERTPLFGLGCAGGVLGLARAAALAKADPDARVLLLVVELCGLTFRRSDVSKSNLVATALFGDGAAAAVVSCRGDGPRLGPWGEHTWPDSLDVMGWEVADDGLKVLFSRDIPSLVRSDLRGVVDAFLRRHNLRLDQVDGYISHPGGAKVLDALQDALDLEPEALTGAREALRAHGNMSAATVLFILRAAMDEGLEGRHLMTTLGPGFTRASCWWKAGELGRPHPCLRCGAAPGRACVGASKHQATSGDGRARGGRGTLSPLHPVARVVAGGHRDRCALEPRAELAAAWRICRAASVARVGDRDAWSLLDHAHRYARRSAGRAARAVQIPASSQLLDRRSGNRRAAAGVWRLGNRARLVGAERAAA
jgi:alkylresorcinol/alkylpyrone synthase